MTSTDGASVGDKYMLSRGFSASVRLNLQYFLWRGDGPCLHPSIPITREGLKVAEIGAGTGIWLTDFARALPPSAQLDGFDLDTSQVPPPEWLPPNVSVRHLNCLEPFPEELIGKYDIVHVQFFNLAIQNRDPVPIVENLLTLLNSGGYISWGEMDFQTWEVVRTSAGSDADPAHITDLLDYVGTVGGTRPDWARDFWPARLHEIYAAKGLTDIVVDRRPYPKDKLPYLLDTVLVACEEMCYSTLDRIGGGRGDHCRDLIQKVFHARSNTAFNLDRLTVIGRKPEAKEESAA